MGRAELAFEKVVEDGGRFGEVFRGYSSRHLIFGRVLVEVIIAGNHAQHHDGADPPNSLDSRDCGERRLEHGNGAVEKREERGVVVKHLTALRVTMIIKHHDDHYTLRGLLHQTHRRRLCRDAHQIVAELLHGGRHVREHHESLDQVQ